MNFSKWLLGLLLAGLGIGFLFFRGEFLKQGLARARSKLPKNAWFEEIRQPWWHTG